ncbi:MAG: hypothetical protein ACLU38_04670 [Dysosmobacter sp.]
MVPCTPLMERSRSPASSSSNDLNRDHGSAGSQSQTHVVLDIGVQGAASADQIRFG